MTTGTPAHSETMDQIQTKLNALMVEPTRNLAEIRQLQQKLRQMISAGR